MATESDFLKALAFTLKAEGGWNPNDAGGGSFRGVRQDTYNKWRTSKGRPPQSVRLATDAEVTDLYREWYWDASGAPGLDMPLAQIHFDTAVNMSVEQANKILRRTGRNAAAYLKDRADVYRQIAAVNPAKAGYLAGWLKRLDQLRGATVGTTMGLVVVALVGWWLVSRAARSA